MDVKLISVFHYLSQLDILLLFRGHKANRSGDKRLFVTQSTQEEGALHARGATLGCTRVSQEAGRVELWAGASTVVSVGRSQ